MSRRWPDRVVFNNVILKDEKAICPLCQANMHVRNTYYRDIHTLNGPVKLACKLLHCSNKNCSNNSLTIRPSEEQKWAMPRWQIGWDVFTWMGYRRFKRHWSVSQIREELKDTYRIELSEDAIEDHIQLYQVMVAARQRDPNRLKKEYEDCKNIILSIDGVQPEKGHETLYVVREHRKGRVWFSEALISSSTEEIERVIREAKNWTNQLGLSVAGWVSDKQQAFVKAIAKIFPKTPHRYCKKHFIMDAAEEMLALDSHAKVQMRKKVRGLRAIERKALEKIKYAEQNLEKQSEEYSFAIKAAQMVIDYCSMVRGILNDNVGDPFHPAGLEMFKALTSVLASIKRNLIVSKEGFIGEQMTCLHTCIAQGLEIYQKDRPKILSYELELKRISKMVYSTTAPCKQRMKAFTKILNRLRDNPDPIIVKISKIMKSFSKGLFAGGDNLDIPEDNFELERWFKIPKGHERRINGHQHAGTRIVYEGPTLLPTLDAHQSLTKPLTAADLLPYADAKMPECQREAMQRRSIMKKGRSKKKDQNFQED